MSEGGEASSFFLNSVRGLIDEELERLDGIKPNDAESLAKWDEGKEDLQEIKSLISRLAKYVPAAEDKVTEEDIDQVESTLEIYRKKLLEWPKKNADDVTDGIMRASLIGVFAGVGMIFGVPLYTAGVAAAIFGGEKIGKAISSAVKSSAGSG